MEPIARPISAATLPLDPAGRIDADIPCRKCGYNLRGLLPDGVCPECATAVGRSLHGDLLRFCDPDWVQTLASGMNWIVAGIVAGFVLGCIAGGVFAGLRPLRMGGTTGLMLAIKLVGAIPLFLGYWRFTTPDPAQSGDQPGVNARQLVRATQILVLCAIPAQWLVGTLPTLVQVTWSGVTELIGLVGLVAAFVYAGRMALRIPDDGLARQTRLVMWGVLVSKVLRTASQLLMPFAFATTMASVTAISTTGPAATSIRTVVVSPTTSTAVTTPPIVGGPRFGPAFAAATVGSCGAGIGMLIFGVWTLRLIDRYRKALRESAEVARLTWASQASPIAVRG